MTWHCRPCAWACAWVLLASAAAQQAAPASAPPATVPQTSAPKTAAPQTAVPQKGIGKLAPKLADVEWVRGKPVKEFTRGTIYVVDFWATWSIPCRDVMPLLKELRQAYAGQRVVFVSVAVWPRFGAIPAEMLLQRRPGLMEDSVARDRMEATSKAWESAIGLEFIPTAVIIDQVGKVAWAGHPNGGLRDALKAVVGKDDALLATTVQANDLVTAQAREPGDALSNALRYEIWSTVPAKADALIALDPQRYVYAAREKYIALLHLGKTADAAACGRELLAGPLHDLEWELDQVAWAIVRPNNKLKPDDLDLDLALAMAQRANELAGGKDWSILDTLGMVHYRRGELEDAITTEGLALAESFSGEERERTQTILQSYTDHREPPEHARPASDGR